MGECKDDSTQKEESLKRYFFFGKQYLQLFHLSLCSKPTYEKTQKLIADEENHLQSQNSLGWIGRSQRRRGNFGSFDFREFQLGPVQWEQPENNNNTVQKRIASESETESFSPAMLDGSSERRLDRNLSSKSGSQTWQTYRHPIFDPNPTVLQVFSICLAVDLFLLWYQYQQVQNVPTPWLVFWTITRLILLVPPAWVIQGVIRKQYLNTWALRISFIIYLMDRVVWGFGTADTNICEHTNIRGAFLMGILWDMILWMFAFGKDLFWGELLYWINMVVTVIHMVLVNAYWKDPEEVYIKWIEFSVYTFVFIAVTFAMILTAFVIGGELDRLMEQRSYINQYVKTNEIVEGTVKLLLQLKQNWLAASLLLVGLAAILFMDTYVRLIADNEVVLAKLVLLQVTISYLMGHLSNMEYIEQQLQNIDASNSVLSDLIPLDVATQLQEQAMNTRSPSRSMSSQSSSELSDVSSSPQLHTMQELIGVVENCIRQWDGLQYRRKSQMVSSRQLSQQLSRITLPQLPPKMQSISPRKEQTSDQLVLIQRRAASLKQMSGRSLRRLLHRSMTKGHGFVAVLFTDIAGFTKLANEQSPFAVMKLLNELYYKYDLLAQHLGVYKVETIGDCYVCAAGLDVNAGSSDNYEHKKVEDIQEDAVDRILKMAFAMCAVASTQYTPNGKQIHFRIGIHSGSVTSGVLGRTRQRYCLFGEAVKGAALMEATCPTDSIQISDRTFRRMEDPCNMSMNWLRYKVETEKRNFSMGTYVCSQPDVLVGLNSC
eukprot:TRINITY_DN6876_c0_g2_i1.p1 TRINITY_DN6876_c0_g2~~TRINITY_DN6876_c0_g2_i1.p1  ORF type:complete len:793 (-),score=82.25 TRINITY_DN6876_c0_g2_i1:616-2928(-)